MKRPSFQFYPADWRKDSALQSCSVAAQGLWINLMCIAHECEPYGYLVVNGKPMNPAQIGRLVGLSLKECAALLSELEDAGVTSTTEQGAIYSRRMVRDEELRNKRANGGHAGAEHGAKGAEHGHKGGRPTKTRGVSEPPIKPPPSSSSSSSSSTSVEIHPPTPRKRGSAFDAAGIELPEWLQSEDWGEWCADRKARGKPITEAGARQQLAKLAEYREQGHAPAAVIAHSIAGGYQGLYPPPHRNGGPQAVETAYQRSMRERAEQFAPGLSAKPPTGAVKPILEVFDVAARRLG